jgi:hypothetical protein
VAVKEGTRMKPENVTAPEYESGKMAKFEIIIQINALILICRIEDRDSFQGRSMILDRLMAE